MAVEGDAGEYVHWVLTGGDSSAVKLCFTSLKGCIHSVARRVENYSNNRFIFIHGSNGYAEHRHFVGKIVRPVDWVNNPPYFFITTWLLFEELAGTAFLTDKTVVRISFLYTVDY